MTTHFFLLSGNLSVERLSWIEECLKFFFVQLYPETLMHRAPAESPAVTFLLTGDALYSLEDAETRQVWEVILSLTAVRIMGTDIIEPFLEVHHFSFTFASSPSIGMRCDAVPTSFP